PALLRLSTEELGLLNDDRVGRALDQLFDADRASLLTELVLRAIAEFQVDCSQLHNDSTSITLYGDYRQADGHERAGKSTVTAARGHNKEGRGDLKQLVLILTVTADGAVPLVHRLTDGNTSDDQTHIATWEGLRELVGSAAFLYVADCKLCTREQMGHIDSNGGRFVTVLPRIRKEDQLLREWMTSAAVDWSEAVRRPGKRTDDPDQVWRVTPAPFPTSEGYHITWVHSSAKQRHDEATRSKRIERARRALAELSQKLAGPRTRVTTSLAAEEAAAAILAATGAERWVRFTVTETVEQRFRQEKRGRPGKDTRYRKLDKTRFTIDVHIDADAVRYDAASDGCFPLTTNDPELTDTEILLAYRYQPNLEKRHHELKSVQDAAPVTLKSPARIEALFCCQFIALLARCLIERELRAAMVRDNVAQLALYPEHRACAAPTAERVFDAFTNLQRHRLTSHGRHIKTFQPQLTALQSQLLDLLGVAEQAYTSGP
ncbi:MAG: IS1634 family transposase, partial [Solirubrobacteraceae bacterium]